MADNMDVRRTSTSVSVDIYDQTYHLRAHDPEYIEKLANTVDSKMRAVSANSNTVDSLRVAVLAALNIADELMRLQEHCRLLHGTMSETQTDPAYPGQQPLRSAGLGARRQAPLPRKRSRPRRAVALSPYRHLPTSFADVSIHSETGLQSRYCQLTLVEPIFIEPGLDSKNRLRVQCPPVRNA